MDAITQDCATLTRITTFYKTDNSLGFMTLALPIDTGIRKQ